MVKQWLYIFKAPVTHDLIEGRKIRWGWIRYNARGRCFVKYRNSRKVCTLFYMRIGRLFANNVEQNVIMK